MQFVSLSSHYINASSELITVRVVKLVWLS